MRKGEVEKKITIKKEKEVVRKVENLWRKSIMRKERKKSGGRGNKSRMSGERERERRLRKGKVREIRIKKWWKRV